MRIRSSFAGALVALSTAALSVACGELLDLRETPDAPESGPPPMIDDGGSEADAVTPGDPILEVSAGRVVACALHVSKKVSCWGENTKGAVGVDETSNVMCGGTPCRPSPVLVKGLSDVIQVAAGADYACALRRDGKVLCWGNNRYGILGVPQQEIPWISSPREVAGLPRAIEIAAGESTVCARTDENGTGVFCWGSRRHGLLGAPSDDSVGGPTKIATADGTSAITLGATGGTACVIGDEGRVSCWGNNSFGAAGVPNSPITCVSDLPCTPTPALVSDRAAVEVRAGGTHVCMRTEDGAVHCWGANDSGQLGRDTVDFEPHPEVVAVIGLSGTTALTAGYNQTCALTDGVLHCWGNNRGGALGSGLDGAPCGQGMLCRATPTLAAEGVGAFTRVSGGWSFTLGVVDGAAFAWGQNDIGQLGHAPNSGGDVRCDSTECNPTPRPITFP